MMLQDLKNDQIFPYFWKQRAKCSGTTIQFTFLELVALGKLIESNTLSDDTLEQILYGSDRTPVYSGWTRQRLIRTLEKSGFKLETISEEKPAILNAVVTKSDWSMQKQFAASIWQLEQRIWTFRKNLRKNFNEVKSRTLLFKNSTFGKNPKWLNLGAGEENYPEYTKIDLSGQQDIYDNIVTLKKIQRSSIEKIYCNHVLEHIPQSLVPEMLKRWHEVLALDGCIMARMPDAKQAILHIQKNWTETTPEKIAALGFPPYLDRESCLTGTLNDDAAIQCIYGWSNSTPHTWDLSNQHKSLWTPDLARKRFEAAGFSVEISQQMGSLNTVIIARKKAV